MAVLQDDLFKRGRTAQRPFSVSGLHYALVFIAVVLLVLARIDHPFARSLQKNLDHWGAGSISWARDSIAPAGILWQRAYLALTGDRELVRLRQENIRLQAIEQRAQQDNLRVQELQQLVNFVGRSQKAPLLTARVLAGANGYFGHSLLIDAGNLNGIREGYAVHSASGLIGRIINTTDNTARVLLLSDAESRVPVAIGDNMYHGVLVGAGSELPRLLFTPEHAEIKEGDQVITSGAAGMLAAGLRVGHISRHEDSFRVHLASHAQKLRYVAIEQHAGPAAHLTEFFAAKALERQFEKGTAPPSQETERERLSKPFAGANLDLGAVSQ